MSPEFSASAAFAIAAVVTFLVTPLAIRVAVATKFYDLPAGYKGHRKPTPYLGGTAIIAGILASVLLVRRSRLDPLGDHRRSDRDLGDGDDR